MRRVRSILLVGGLATMLASVIALAESSPSEVETQAAQAVEAGDLGGAIRALQRLRYYEQLSAPGRLLLARTFLRLGRLDEASGEVEVLLVGDPNNPGGLILKGELAARAGDWTLALDLYRRVVQQQPNNPDAQIHLSQALQRLGETEAADAALARYIELTR